MWDVVQIVGAVLVLAGFLAAQLGWLDEHAYAYLIPNAIGSGALAITAVVTANWGFVLLEGVWCLVSLWGLARSATGDRSGANDAARRTP